MPTSKIEFKIVKDTNGHDIDLNNMSLAVTRTLLSLLTSLTNIIDLADNNHQVNIKIIQGSATLVAEGPEAIIQEVETDFNEVVEHKATNKALVGFWGDIQTVFQANGLEYEANIYKGQVKVPVLEKIKTSNTFKPKIRRIKKDSETSLSFVTGKLYEVGGKKPNIHVVGNAAENYTIGCDENEAIKVNKFLYKQVYLSAWRKKKSGENPTYTFCDFYVDNNVFDDFKQFIDENSKLKEVDALVSLHNKLKGFLDSRDFGNMRKFLRLYKHESLDVSTLKTILVITKSFKEEEKISDLRKSIKDILESKIGTLV
jgi:hypothetical protein